MDPEKVRAGELGMLASRTDRGLHSGDVVQYLDGYLIRGITAESDSSFGVEEPSRCCIKAFDSRGRDRSVPGELWRDRFRGVCQTRVKQIDTG